MAFRGHIQKRGVFPRQVIQPGIGKRAETGLHVMGRILFPDVHFRQQLVSDHVQVEFINRLSADKCFFHSVLYKNKGIPPLSTIKLNLRGTGGYKQERT